MAKLAVIFFAALAFHATLAAPQAAQGNQLEDLANQIQTASNDFAASLQKLMPDTKTITDHTKKFTQDVEAIVGKLQTEVDSHKGKSDDVVKQVSAKLSETISALQQLSGPDATAKANELKTQLETNVKSAAAEMEKLGKAIQPNIEHAGESVNTFFKGIFDDFLKATNDLQTNVEKNVAKH